MLEIFVPIQDFSMQPPAQEIVARDLHDTVWTFRHIFRGKLIQLSSFLLDAIELTVDKCIHEHFNFFKIWQYRTTKAALAYKWMESFC